MIFTDDPSFDNGEKVDENEWYSLFNDQEIKESCTVYCKDLEAWISKLRKRFEFVRAGGGFVRNRKGNLLVIHRRGYWDLPKGKLEPKEKIEECAKREVEEETGIGQLKIDSEAFITYHLYSEKKKTVGKESHWYLMSTKSDADPVAQTEEDIKEAIWVKLPVKKKIFKGAYTSIQDVIDHYSGMI